MRAGKQCFETSEKVIARSPDSVPGDAAISILKEIKRLLRSARNDNSTAKGIYKRFRFIIPAVALILGLTSCASLDPRRPDVELEETRPYENITSYTQALYDLGLMTEIYGAPSLKIQANSISDNTGSSAATGAEVPRDVTEIMKSSLNSIGGKVVFIPYDPSFMQSQVVTGYSSFQNKAIPDVVLTGGITEFDRGLETRSSGNDANLGNEWNGMPEGLNLPTASTELRYSQGNKSALSRITLDFNLLDFESMTGIPHMNTTNSMKVGKALNETEMGISLFGQSFGGKGSVKKVQGRHAAVRLLVELSMIQIIGKHLRLPYWRLLGKEAKPDKYIIEQFAQYYRALTDAETITNAQEWLYLSGNNTEITGTLDEITKNALQAINQNYDSTQARIDFTTFASAYFNIPITSEAKRRREALK